MGRKRNTIVVVLLMVSLLLGGILGRTGYTLLAERNDLNNIDILNRQSDIQFGERSIRRPHLSEELAEDILAGKDAGQVRLLIAHILMWDQSYTSFVAGRFGADEHRAIRLGQLMLLESRDGFPPPGFSSNPTYRERALQVFEEILRTYQPEGVLAGIAHSGICQVHFDRMFDENPVFDVMESYQLALKYCIAATKDDPASDHYKRNVELLLSLEGKAQELALAAQAGAGDEEGEPGSVQDGDPNPDKEPPGGGTTDSRSGF